MYCNRILISCAIAMALVLGAGCSKQSQEDAKTSAQAEAPAVTTAPVASAVEASAVSRVPLPFDEMDGNYDFQTPSDAQDEGAGASGNMFYHKVVHPIGQVRALTINGQDVAIKNPVLAEGLLETQDFGLIEFRLMGVMNNQTIVQLLATQEQIAKMQAVIPENKK